MSTTEAPIFVVVCDNDVPHPRWGVDPHGPLVHETYTNGATRDAALARSERMKQWGRCRIARLVFEDEPERSASQQAHGARPRQDEGGAGGRHCAASGGQQHRGDRQR